MARRKRKKSTSVFGAIAIEAFAALIFVFLFTQARAERQKASGVEKEPAAPAIETVFQKMPFEDLLAQGPSWKN